MFLIHHTVIIASYKPYGLRSVLGKLAHNPGGVC